MTLATFTHDATERIGEIENPGIDEPAQTAFVR
jgi:hypothetical protein